VSDAEVDKSSPRYVREVTERMQHVGFDDCARMAGDPTLTEYEKIGFPDVMRRGKTETIFADIESKLGVTAFQKLRVIDIGPGCTDLPVKLVHLCGGCNHELWQVDSPEMLAQLPDEPWVLKVPGRFPDDLGARGLAGKFDRVLAYSLLHMLWGDSNPVDFVDAAVELLAPGGRLLVGDVPNVSKAARFYATAAGLDAHRKFVEDADAPPPVVPLERARGRIDDGYLLGLVTRYRGWGYEAYLLPQDEALPYASRREDLLIVRP
jgi:SAM-dependent methyltransferase